MSQGIWVLVERLQGEITELSYSMLAAGRTLADGLDVELTALLLGGEVTDAATVLAADHVVVVEHPSLADFNPDANVRAVSAVLAERAPRLLLCGHTTMGMDVAGGVALRLRAPTLSSCRTFAIAAGQARFTAITCGGKIEVEGTLPGPVCVATMIPGGEHPPTAGKPGAPPEVTRIAAPPDIDDARTRFRRYVQPDTSDVDIARESILVSVGRGIQERDNLQLAENLAVTLGGVVSASRPIVDSDWLPTTRLVGKSGKSVKPRLYLAVGISGAPEHLEGITGCDLMVAINTDERAPIFDVAHYGTHADACELLPVLTEKIKGGVGV